MGKERTRHKLFIQVISELYKYDVQSVAEASGVHYATLYNWMGGKTLTPRIDTLFAVAETIGFDVTWTRKRSKKAA